MMGWSCTLSCHEPKWCIANTKGIKTSSIANVVPENLQKHHQCDQWAQNVELNRQEQPFGGAAPFTKMVVMTANAWWLMWHQMWTKCDQLRPETKKSPLLWCTNQLFVKFGHGSNQWWGDRAHCHAIEPKWCVANIKGIKTSSLANAVPENLQRYHQCD